MVAPVLLIGGPTGAGKSALALQCALQLNGEILSIDSVQVYQGFDIGSAKASPAERNLIPHHLLDIFSPTERGDVARFVSLAIEKIEEVQSRGKFAVLAGGSTMYVTSLFHGLATLPAADPTRRAVLEQLDNATLYQRLAALDPASAAQLHPNDRARVIRAIEISESSGGPASALRQQHVHAEQRLCGLMVVLVEPREHLYARLNQRAQQIVAAGLLDEVRQLQRLHGNDLPGLETIGYREAVATLRGELTEAALASEIATHTRQFAKRQLTFWANEPRKRGWMVRPSESEPSVSVQGENPLSTAALKVFRAFSFSAEELLQRVTERMALAFDRPEVWYVQLRR